MASRKLKPPPPEPMVEERVEVLSRWDSHTSDELIKLIDDSVARVPVDLQPSVLFSIDMKSEPYDSGEYPKLFMTYKRPETEKEKRTRVANEEKMAAGRAEYERKEYLRLKKQFEGKK